MEPDQMFQLPLLVDELYKRYKVDDCIPNILRVYGILGWLSIFCFVIVFFWVPQAENAAQASFSCKLLEFWHSMLKLFEFSG